MRDFMLVVLLAACIAGSASASIIWQDSFDGYSNQAEFNAVWIPNTSPLLLVDAAPAGPTPPKAIMQDLTARSSRRAIGQNVPSDKLYLGFWFYDETPGMSRTYGMAYARGGTGLWTDPLDQLLAIGKYHTITSTKYFARVGFGASAPAGGGWFTLDSGPDRSIGWHFAEIVSDSGLGVYQFYIDGILGGAIQNTTPLAQFNWVVMGSGLSTTGGMMFDNVAVGVVPEPSSLVALGAGVAAMAGVRRRRGR